MQKILDYFSFDFYAKHKDFLDTVNLESKIGSEVQTNCSRVDPYHRFIFTKEMLDSGVWEISDVGSYDTEYKLVFRFERSISKRELEEAVASSKRQELWEKAQYEKLKKKFE